MDLLFVGESQTLVSQAATVEQEVTVTQEDVVEFDQATLVRYVNILRNYSA